MIGNHNEAKIYAFVGSSGCGKTTRASKLLSRPKRRRTMFWSPKEAIDNYASYYAGTVICTSATDVLEACKKAGARGELHIVFKPNLQRNIDEKLFHAFCKIAMAAGNVTVLVDELHTVTKPNHACDGWRELVMMGRGYGVEIFGMSQRPASMDKDFLGNASIINVGRLSYPEDAKTVARSLGVKNEEVAALNGYMWIERNNITGKITKG